jgi:uncharacterized membrane protein YbaN (DUF454 family)
MKPDQTRAPGIVPNLRKQLRVIAGFILLAGGLVGLVVPFMPGTLLIMAGIALVGADHPWLQPAVKRIRDWVRRWRPIKESN